MHRQIEPLPIIRPMDAGQPIEGTHQHRRDADVDENNDRPSHERAGILATHKSIDGEDIVETEQQEDRNEPPCTTSVHAWILLQEGETVYG